MDSIKKNNDGFTLIELLITVIIIGIIAVPFVNSFIQAMRINVDARRLQNATLAAQDIAEEFKADTLSDLLDKYAYTITKESGKLDIYNINNIKVTGADGEDFFVDVQLDPNLVYDSDGDCVNGGVLPMFSNLFGGDTVIIFKQYVESDVTVNRELTNKVCDINIVCTENKTGGEYTYSYVTTLSTYYTYKDGTTPSTTPVIKKVEKTFSADDKHTIYLLASVFDVYSHTAADTEGNFYGSDKINITYSYSGDSTRQKDVTFYLAEQAHENKYNNVVLSRLNPANVTIKIGDEIKNLSEYVSADNKFKINTNAGKEIEDKATVGTLSYDPNNMSESLFFMNISVKYGSKTGKVLTTFETTKEE